jgi:hypothetical protein
VGLLDGPEIGKRTARALGLDLNALNQRLYVDVQRALPDAQVSVESSAPGGSMVRIQLGEESADLPVNKNLLLLAGQSLELEGLVVYIPDTKRIYLPLQAVQLIAGQQVCLPPIAKVK